MLTLLLILCEVALANQVGSPVWQQNWGLLRLQTSLIGERSPEENQLKWRAQSFRVDTAIHDNLGTWVEARRTDGVGKPNEAIGGYGFSGGLRTSAWLIEPIGFGLQAVSHFEQVWTTGTAGGIKTRQQRFHLDANPSIIIGNSSAQTWIGLSAGLSRTTDMLVAEPQAEWSALGVRGWALGAELRSDNLNGFGSRHDLRTFLGVELRWLSDRSCALWTGLAF